MKEDWLAAHAPACLLAGESAAAATRERAGGLTRMGLLMREAVEDEESLVVRVHGRHERGQV
jgi:hypothetical protein